jgi:hypothetical protein
VQDHWPLLSIASIVSSFGGTIDATTYEIQRASIGFISRRTGWAWTAPSLPNIRQSAFAGQERRAYTVTYTGGYVTPEQVAQTLFPGPVTLPGDLQQAAIILVVALYRSQGVDPSIKAESLMSYSVTYREGGVFGGLLGAGEKTLVNLVIAQYRRMTVAI